MCPAHDDESGACPRCRGTGRVFFLRPWFAGALAVLLAGLCWGYRERFTRGIGCGDLVILVGVIVWILGGGLWTSCPRCSELPTPREELARTIAALRSSTGWGSRLSVLVARITLPLFRRLSRDMASLPHEGDSLLVARLVNLRVVRGVSGLALLTLIVVLCIHALLIGLFVVLANPPFMLIELLVSVGLAILLLVLLLIQVSQHVRAACRDMMEWYGTRFCAVCDYDLRGNTTGVCPECGTSIASSSHAPHRYPEVP
jgi:hypothetical protein